MEPLQQEDREEVPTVTAEEVEAQLKKMAGGKAADQAGVVAELLKKGGRRLTKIMAEIFTALLREEVELPEYWRVAVVKVLFKEGDDMDPANYRPIALLNTIYKIYGSIIQIRLANVLDDSLWETQFGFRKNGARLNPSS